MIRLALRVRHADAELVLAELLEIAPSGVEEVELPVQDGGEGVVEYAVYGSPGELPELPDLQAAAGEALVDVSAAEVPDDWSERWKQFHQPVLVEAPLVDVADRTGPLIASEGHNVPELVPSNARVRKGSGYQFPRCIDVPVGAPTRAAPHARVEQQRPRGHSLHVRPPWEEPSDRPDALEIVIDPAQAFGTGAHATTRLCLELLLQLAASDDARGPVLDVGAGSGVLAIAAAKLGYGPVLALDNDPESVLATAANATANDVEIEMRLFDLRREWLSEIDGAPVPIVLANLLRPLLIDLAAAIDSPPRHLIASGLLREQADEVEEAFARRLGLRERARRERGEWAALWLMRDAGARSPRAPSP
jgi:ribosomal protein L11 methyltransferase